MLLPAVFLRLAQEGFDPRTTGNRQVPLGRVAHNLGQMIIAQFATAIPQQLVSVAGVAKKLAHPAPAKDLYCSSWWKLARNYIEASQIDWRVLSSRYGLLHPDKTLSPHEENPNEKSQEQRIAWAKMVTGICNSLSTLSPAKSKMFNYNFDSRNGNRFAKTVVAADGS